MTKKIYFISDIHFHLHNSPDEDIKKKRFFKFLERVRQDQADLYIVGDLFDFWFEYNFVIPRHFLDVIHELQKTRRKGCDIHIIVGNHDYWMYDFFTRDLDIKIHYEPLSTEFDNKKVFILHGDGLLKRKDFGYRILKKILRNRICIFLFKILHPDFSFRIARAVSSKSRGNSVGRISESEQQEVIEFGKKKFLEGYKYVITGHFHNPTDFRDQNNVFLNLGDWMEFFTFAVYEKNDISLCYWKDGK